MSCSDKFIETATGGSDIDFSIRWNVNSEYPSISDAYMRFVGIVSDVTVVDIDTDSVEAGTSITVSSDDIGDLINVHIAGEDTVGVVGNMDFNTVIDSEETGRRSEVKGTIIIEDGGGL